MRQEQDRLDRPTLCRTLTTMLDCMTPEAASVDYRLIGTAASVLHGVCLPAHDVDILMRHRRDVDTFGAMLSRFRCLQAPVWMPDSRQYFARYDVDAVEVELSTVELEIDADVYEAVGTGPWRYCSTLRCGRHEVPTIALELRLITELRRNRADRYQPLIDYLAEHGCNFDLMRRGLETSGVADSLRKEVWARLTAAANTAP